MTRLSGWCSPSCGPRAHAARQVQQDKGAVVCECERHGGHEKPAVDRDSASEPFAIGGETRENWGNKTAPRRCVNTVDPRGLANADRSVD